MDDCEEMSCGWEEGKTTNRSMILQAIKSEDILSEIVLHIKYTGACNDVKMYFVLDFR